MLCAVSERFFVPERTSAPPNGHEGQGCVVALGMICVCSLTFPFFQFHYYLRADLAKGSMNSVLV